MEQIIDVFGIDWRIMVVQIVNFTLLLGVLWYFLYTPLTNLIENRRKQIIQGVADAERAEASLKDADAKKGEIITQASLEAEKVIASARETGKVKEAKIIEEAHAKSERMLTEATMKGQEIKQEALHESKEEMARLVVLGVEKALRAQGSGQTS